MSPILRDVDRAFWLPGGSRTGSIDREAAATAITQGYRAAIMEQIIVRKARQSITSVHCSSNNLTTWQANSAGCLQCPLRSTRPLNVI
jgi:hypothetical protein